MRRLERHGCHGTAEEFCDQVNPELMQIRQAHDENAQADRRVESTARNSTDRHRAGQEP